MGFLLRFFTDQARGGGGYNGGRLRLLRVITYVPVRETEIKGKNKATHSMERDGQKQKNTREERERERERKDKCCSLQ